MFLSSVHSERQTVEVHSVVLSIAPHVQKVPPDPMVLGNQQTRKCLCHIAIDRYEIKRTLFQSALIMTN